jgi:hypothetical protein
MAWVAMAETLASGKLNNGVATAYARVMLVPGLFLLIVAVVSEQHGPDWALPLCLAISVVMSLAAVISARATAHFFEKRRGWETRPRWGMFSRALAFLRG